MHHPPLNFGPVAPELVLVGVGLLLLLVEAISKRVTHAMLAAGALVGLAGAAVASILLWNWHGPATVLGGMVAADRFSVFARVIVLGVGAVGVAFGYHYFERVGE